MRHHKDTFMSTSRSGQSLTLNEF
uniref:Uncharacterized protein n=1 Tax=Echinococcus granulosus TaxID=6210 RepID=A0A068X4J5_ECHGR|nr:hypothetical protein EgrG_002000400 [Echinococcus granulosus]